MTYLTGLASPRRRWKKSKPGALLNEDVKKNVVTCDYKNKPVMSLEEIYTMNEEYAEYSFDKFEERLKSILKIVVEMDNRAEADELALELYQRTLYFIFQLEWPHAVARVRGGAGGCK
jgi:hypothetical protein